MQTRGPLKILQQRGFQVLGIRFHLAGCDLLFACPAKTQLADAQTVPGADRRAEYPAGQGTGLVKLASSGLRVEDRAGLVVGEVSEPRNRGSVLMQPTRHWISRKIWRQPAHCVLGTRTHAGCPFRGALFKIGEALAKTESVELVDGKRSHAALRTSRPADQPLSATAGGFGESRVDNLNQ